MKKLMLAGIFVLIGATTMNAQRVQKGERQINAGVINYNSWEGLPIYVGYDYGVHKDITIGVQGSYASKSNTTNILGTSYSYSTRWIAVGLNGNYHFNSLLNIPNNWDLYAGISLTYNSVSVHNNSSVYNNNFPFYNNNSSIYNNNISVTIPGFGFSVQIGGRYYFTNNFGVNLEFGGGDFATGGKAGISYKF